MVAKSRKTASRFNKSEILGLIFWAAGREQGHSLGSHQLDPSFLTDKALAPCAPTAAKLVPKTKGAEGASTS
jgi:hypothetical protein